MSVWSSRSNLGQSIVAVAISGRSERRPFCRAAAYSKSCRKCSQSAARRCGHQSGILRSRAQRPASRRTAPTMPGQVSAGKNRCEVLLELGVHPHSPSGRCTGSSGQLPPGCSSWEGKNRRREHARNALRGSAVAAEVDSTRPGTASRTAAAKPVSHPVGDAIPDLSASPSNLLKAKQVTAVPNFSPSNRSPSGNRTC